MEEEEEQPREEQVEVAVVFEEESTAPQECDLSGSGSREEEVQPEGYERHRAVKPGYYTALLDLDPASFNRTLKILFAFTVGAALLGIILVEQLFSRRFLDEASTWSLVFNHSWLLGFFPFGENNVYLLALFAAVVGLGLDVERPGIRLRPAPNWMVRAAKWTLYELKKNLPHLNYYCKILQSTINYTFNMFRNN